MRPAPLLPLAFAVLIATAPAYSQQILPPPPHVQPASEQPRTTHNVRVDVTVRTEDSGKSQVVYQVSGVLGDGERQEFLTAREVFVSSGPAVAGAPESGNYRSTGLFVTATPLVEGRNVRLAFTLDVSLPLTARQSLDRNMPPTAKQQATTILESGKPLTVFTSDSPGNTPKIAVEITATILEANGQRQLGR
jgi:hypothetical protein